MTQVLGIGLIIAGAVMLFMGVQASQSFTSEVSEVFTGSPTDKAMWLLIGGPALAVMGIALLFMRKRV